MLTSPNTSTILTSSSLGGWLWTLQLTSFPCFLCWNLFYSHMEFNVYYTLISSLHWSSLYTFLLFLSSFPFSLLPCFFYFWIVCFLLLFPAYFLISFTFWFILYLLLFPLQLSFLLSLPLWCPLFTTAVHARATLQINKHAGRLEIRAASLCHKLGYCTLITTELNNALRSCSYSGA